MKKTLLLLLMILTGITQAARAINGLWLEKQDGSLVGYVFEQGINISYKFNTVVMTTNTASAEYPFDDIKRIYFEDDVTKIVSATTAAKLSQISLTSDGVSLTGFAPYTTVWVYDTKGHPIMKSSTDVNGSLLVNIKQLPKGIYIVKAERNAVKIKTN